MYETLALPTRILILHALADRPMGFSEFKRVTNIESSGNLSFHLGKLGPLIKNTSEGDYGLMDEGKEAIRVLEVTELVNRQTRTSEGRVRAQIGKKASAALLAFTIMLGISMIVTGTFLASQSTLIVNQTITSPTNFTLSPGGQKILFAEGGTTIYGATNLLYLLVKNPPTPTAMPELRIDAIGTANNTVYSTHADYADTDFGIPQGTNQLNFSISDQASFPITVVVTYIRLGYYNRPNLGIGNSILYTGTAIIIASIVTLGVWILRRNRESA